MVDLLRLGLSASLCAFLMSGSAMAATLNFTSYIDTTAGEKAVVQDFSLGGYTISAHGSTVTSASAPVPVGFADYSAGTSQAYFDRGGAGIGVCRNVVGTQCSPANDDNVTGPNTPGGPIEILSLAFDKAVTVSELIFKAEGHNFSFNSPDAISISKNGGLTWSVISLLYNNTGKLFGSPTFDLLAGQFMHFKFHNEQFYLSGATVNTRLDIPPPVPVPAALPLLASGLGALGFIGWRRKRKLAQAQA